MSKTFLFKIVVVLGINLPLYSMDLLGSFDACSSLIRNISAASTFVSKHGWPMLVTGASVVTLCNYNKPILWYGGIAAISALFVYRDNKRQNQMDELMKVIETNERKHLDNLKELSKQIDSIKTNVTNNHLESQNTQTFCTSLKDIIEEYQQNVTNKFDSLDPNVIKQLGQDVVVVKTNVNTLQERRNEDNKQLTTLNTKILDLTKSFDTLSNQQKTILTHQHEMNRNIQHNFGAITHTLSHYIPTMRTSIGNQPPVRWFGSAILAGSAMTKAGGWCPK